MIKRFFSFIFAMLIFMFSMCFDTSFSYAQANVSAIGADFGFLSGAGTQLGNSIPTVFPGALYNQVDNYISGEGKKYAEQQYNNLSDSDKAFYQNVDKYYTFNKFECDSTAMTNSWNKDIDALKGFSKPYLQTLNNYYQNISSQVGQMKNQLNMTVQNGVSSAGQTIDELISSFKSTKVRFQTDTDFINSSYDSYKSRNKTLSDTYSVSNSLSNKNYQNMTYGNLYYSLSAEASRAKFLYYISDRISRYFTDSDASEGYNIPYLKPVTFILMPDYYNNTDFKELNRVIMDSCRGDKFLFYQCKYTTNVSELISKGKLGKGALSTNAYCNDMLYYVSGIGYDFNFQEVKNSNARCYVPASLVSSTVSLPFNSLEDISNYRKNYLACVYPNSNRPVNYVMNIDSLMSKKYSDIQPLTKELLANVPSISNVNVSTLPLADSGALPSNHDVQKQKELMGIPGVIPNTDINTQTGVVPGTQSGPQPGTQPGTSSLDLTNFLTDLLERLKELLKSLFVPSDTFFDNEIQSLKTSLEGKIDVKYIDKIFSQINNFGTYNFDDVYAIINGKNVKIFDFGFVRKSLPDIKKITDPFFYLLLMLYVYNEIVFLIRGIYPLSLRRGDSNNDN